MKTWFNCLLASLVLVVICSYAWIHRHHVAIPATAIPAETQHYAEEEQASQMVTVSGPMANYVLRQQSGSGNSGSANVETLQPTYQSTSQSASQSSSHKPVASDHVTDDSPVGTGMALLHKTFNVAGIVNLPFDLPAHASTPQLRGTYRSFLSQAGLQHASEHPDDHSADVEFLVMNEQQYNDLLNGRPGDALFSADDASNGEVNFTLPPTFGQTAKYYLVFRNGSQGKGKRVVQADFRVDF
jgi:hypothetical protein